MHQTWEENINSLIVITTELGVTVLFCAAPKPACTYVRVCVYDVCVHVFMMFVYDVYVHVCVCVCMTVCMMCA